MKINYFFKRSLFTIILVCGILLCFAQCKQDAVAEFKSKGGLRVLMALDEASLKSDDKSVEMRNDVLKALRSRIEYYGVNPHIEWLEAEKRILVEIPGVKEPDRTLRLLGSNANIEFWETFDLVDVYEQIVKADDRLAKILALEDKNKVDEQSASSSNDKLAEGASKDELEGLLESIENTESIMLENEYEAAHPLFAKLQLNMFHDPRGYDLVPGPVIGYIEESEVAQVIEYLNMPEIKSLLPSNIIFKQGARSINNSEDVRMYDLYAIKQTSRDGAELNGDAIAEAKVFSDSEGGNSVALQMDAEGARQWARMTKENIGQCIAIVLDDKVYSAPRVNDQITGGRSMISGYFTKEEAIDLANILNAGRMPVPVRIVHHEMVSPVTK
ncbi:MAG: hypothetical protein LBV72_07980 [Tannerella sp.]|jgi:SecD/SecF fusion protein|nr:hypothetical protein [Tannerella sp.]